MSDESTAMTHIWVTQDFADKFKEATSLSTQADLIKQIFQRQERSLEAELEYLDEATARFKAGCILQRSELQKVYEEQQEKLEKFLEKTWDFAPEVKRNAQRLTDEIQPLGDKLTDLDVTLNSLSNKINSINTHGINEILALANKLETLPAETKEIMQFLIASHSKMQLVK